MSEWFSVLAVFWLLWAVDGAKLVAWRVFTFVGGAWGRGRARVSYSRMSLPGLWSGSWRVVMNDVPLALSPDGVCNVPAGSTGRPAEKASQAAAWRWEDVRDVGVARGWIFVNGARFCRDTGHVKAPELLTLARLPRTERERKIDRVIRRWLRPAHLKRRATVLAGRTRVTATLNSVLFIALAVLTVYVLSDVASMLPGAWSERIASGLPYGLLGLLTLHLAAVVMAWRAKRRLRPVAPEKRGAALFSALLLPPQAMRLRALLGEGFFPAQHPLSAVLAWSGQRERQEWAFNAFADLRWPIGERDEPPFAREIASWFRAALGARMETALKGAGVVAETLLAAPEPDSPASCSYCPRCRDQFAGKATVCPNGVPLRFLTRS
jgi:hypothetical protein